MRGILTSCPCCYRHRVSWEHSWSLFSVSLSLFIISSSLHSLSLFLLSLSLSLSLDLLFSFLSLSLFMFSCCFFSPLSLSRLRASFLPPQASIGGRLSVKTSSEWRIRWRQGHQAFIACAHSAMFPAWRLPVHPMHAEIACALLAASKVPLPTDAWQLCSCLHGKGTLRCSEDQLLGNSRDLSHTTGKHGRARPYIIR